MRVQHPWVPVADPNDLVQDGVEHGVDPELEGRGAGSVFFFEGVSFCSFDPFSLRRPSTSTSRNEKKWKLLT